MKVLIVAHPDDEVLWFNPEEYDRIIVVFCDRTDKPAQGDARRKAMLEHPLIERMECLNLTESNYWRDKTRKAIHEANYKALCVFLASLQADTVNTHDAQGEYQHADHLLVHKACMMTLNCPVNGKNPEIYRQARAAYERNRCWTWY
jgi:LmbE family N-acetylglucosaminyl deacetylase